MLQLDYQVSHASSPVASFVYYTVCVGRVKTVARLPSLSCKFTCCQLCLLYCMCGKSEDCSKITTCCQLCLLYCMCGKSEDCSKITKSLMQVHLLPALSTILYVGSS